MTDAGCPIDQSAIFKIERTTPRRRIVVDEMVTFSQVFGLPLDELLMPPELAVFKDLGRLVVEWDRARKATDEAGRARDAAALARDEAWAVVTAFVASQPDAAGALEIIIEEWSSSYFDDDRKDFQTAWLMWKATGSEQWKKRAKKAFDDELKGGK